MISPAFSITIDELSPKALAGKTLTFNIDYGGAPFATTGSWTGKFETSPANGFTIRKLTGDTVNCNATIALKEFAFGNYTYTVTPFIAGQKPALMYLWVTLGVANYEIFITGNDKVSLSGTLVIGTPPKAPEIEVNQPVGTNIGNYATRKFSTVKTGSTSVAKTFTIKNTGKAPLTGIATSKSGAQDTDFIVSAPGKTSLPPGTSTTFTVKFKPTASGARYAMVSIANNDSNENPFYINLTGTGAP